ncbi:hypothetical protein ASF91_06505 [Rhizobium sp. Leaf155]|nr:hypothetical protein ASF91_06505 [Rhizobium sp. Leaf155]
MFKWVAKKRKKLRRKRADRHLQLLDTFFPNSDNYWDYPKLAYSAANKFPEQIRQLLPEARAVLSYSDLSDDEHLKNLFNKYGSDKSRHGYVPIYSQIFRSFEKRDLTLLEVGLGTNNPALISSMGSGGKPGASLRAFRDYLPEATIFGADIDKDILFSEDRIKTGWVDQTDLQSFHQLNDKFGRREFDIVIDDGLHSTEANMNTLLFWRAAAAPGGWMVIEDIPERTIHVWHTVVFLLRGAGHEAMIYKTVAGYVVVAQKRVP